jgi:hypothetical protein
MARIVKHIGKHNNRKVVIIYKTIPGEDHMCLVVYPDALPMMYHDEVMKVLESSAGQTAKELADPLFRHIMPDGNNTLVSLHKANQMKKVPCNQVLVTPNAQSSVRLDELNEMLAQMEQGEAAVKKMAELDEALGMSGHAPKKGKQPAEKPAVVVNESGVLSDADLAAQRTAQAASFRAQAQSLLAEAQRLEAEASAMVPGLPETTTKSRNVRKPRTKKVTA